RHNLYITIMRIMLKDESSSYDVRPNKIACRRPELLRAHRLFVDDSRPGMSFRRSSRAIYSSIPSLIRVLQCDRRGFRLNSSDLSLRMLIAYNRFLEPSLDS
ncbi:hypothetical protein HID58_028621, partial [Brassica napus]